MNDEPSPPPPSNAEEIVFWFPADGENWNHLLIIKCHISKQVRFYRNGNLVKSIPITDFHAKYVVTSTVPILPEPKGT